MMIALTKGSHRVMEQVLPIYKRDGALYGRFIAGQLTGLPQKITPPGPCGMSDGGQLTAS